MNVVVDSKPYHSRRAALLEQLVALENDPEAPRSSSTWMAALEGGGNLVVVRSLPEAADMDVVVPEETKFEMVSGDVTYVRVDAPALRTMYQKGLLNREAEEEYEKRLRLYPDSFFPPHLFVWATYEALRDAQ